MAKHYEEGLYRKCPRLVESGHCQIPEANYDKDVKPNFKSLLAAPAPVFVLVALVITRPSLGWLDVASSLGIAFASSYGILIAGLPIHLLLRRVNRSDFASYLLAFLFALVAVIAVSVIVESAPPSPLPNDNSPFAEMTMGNGGWIVSLLFGVPIVTVIAWITWRFAASPFPDE